MIKRAIATLVVLCGGLLAASCTLNVFGDECYSDSDCPRGYVCDYWGLRGNTCIPGCSRHTDCPDGQYCTSCDSNGCHGEGRCMPGCRTSDECSETRWCDNGVCVRGCFGDVCAYGRPGSVCIASNAFDAGSECRYSCEVDSDCAGALAEQCTAGVCVQPCDSDRDCGASFSCKPMNGCASPVCFLR